MLEEQRTVPGNVVELVESISLDLSGSNKYKRFQQMYSGDRIAFVHDVMPEVGQTITPYQEEILGYFDDGHTRVAVRGPHGLGKTFIAAILVHHMVLTSEVDAKVPTTASAWRQLEKYLWPEIGKLSKLLAWHEVGRRPYDPRSEFLQLSIKIKDRDVEAFALASDDHTTLEGAHATNILFVFDEAKTIPVPTWDAVEGAFSTEGLSHHYEALAFAISTPGDPSGRFYDIHMRSPGYEDWKVRHVTIDEAVSAGRISGKWVDQREKQWGRDNPVFQNRVLGEFADNSEDGVIPLSWVRIAIDRGKQGVASEFEGTQGKWAGVDVARMGRDATAIAVRVALRLKNIYMFRKSPTTVTAGRVSNICRDHVVNIEMDGLGAAVYDMLKESGFSTVRPIHPNAKTHYRDKSGELSFLNVRAAMWWRMRELLDPVNGHDVILPDHDVMIGDLVAPRWSVTSTGKIKLESKEDLMKRLGRSPDVGTAVCMCYWSASQGGGIVF